MPTLVLFDVDGTLVQAAGAGRAAIQTALLEVYGMTGPIDTLPFDGLTDGQIVRALLRASGMDDPEIDAGLEGLWRAYVGHLEAELSERRAELRTEVGVLDLLDALGEAGVQVGLVTGNISAGAEKKLAACGLAGRFRFGAFGSDAEDRDRLPTIALDRAHEATGIRFGPDEAWIVGDTPRDVSCARAAGLRALGVGTGRYSPRALRACGAHRAVASLVDTRAILRIFVADGRIRPADARD